MVAEQRISIQRDRSHGFKAYSDCSTTLASPCLREGRTTLLELNG
jgi:hypothetical protein